MEIVVDIKKLRQNVINLKKLTSAKFYAVVKCNAYGHGTKEVALAINDLCDGFVVACTSEAEEIFSAGIRKDILILSDIFDENNYPDNFIFCAFDEISYDKLFNSNRRFFVKVNTGMNRLGFNLERLSKINCNVANRNVHSVCSHLYDVSSQEIQTSVFECISTDLTVKKHIYASNFSGFTNKNHYDIVRCGLALYGYGANCVSPIMSIFAPILQKRWVKMGENVGYGINPIEEDCIIAIVKIGYGDGLRRKINGERRFVFVDGIKCEVVGQICMDMCMVKLSDNLINAEKVEILGGHIDAIEVAKQWHTIPYEVLTSLSKGRANIKYVK